MIKIADGFRLPESIDLSVLETLPVMSHPYGGLQPSNDVFRWMTYYDADGEIAFARNLGTFMPEVAAYTVEFLSSRVEGKFDPHRVNFMRTLGNVSPHIDEGGRNCCINIGVRGASNAVTQFAISDNFEAEHGECTVQDGCAYLLDVSRIHAVKSVKHEHRLLISYGFGVSFDDVLKRVRRL